MERERWAILSQSMAAQPAHNRYLYFVVHTISRVYTIQGNQLLQLDTRYIILPGAILFLVFNPQYQYQHPSLPVTPYSSTGGAAP